MNLSLQRGPRSASFSGSKVTGCSSHALTLSRFSVKNSNVHILLFWTHQRTNTFSTQQNQMEVRHTYATLWFSACVSSCGGGGVWYIHRFGDSVGILVFSGICEGSMLAWCRRSLLTRGPSDNSLHFIFFSQILFWKFWPKVGHFHLRGWKIWRHC